MITTTSLFLILMLAVYTLVWRSSKRLRRSVAAFLVWAVMLGVVGYPYVRLATPYVNQGLEVAAPYVRRGLTAVRDEIQAELAGNYPDAGAEEVY